jgi:hypothetical protein
MKAKLLYTNDNTPKKLKAGNWVLNTSSNEITQMTEISSAIFGNDAHLLKLEQVGNNLLLNNEIIAVLTSIN